MIRRIICLTDIILFMENGNIIEQGNHHDLIEQQGQYYTLLKKQSELEVFTNE